MTSKRLSRNAAGLSLVELMIAMVIGLILLLGLVQVMTASRAAYQLSFGVARTQENARFAMDFLQRDLRMAGHLGCASDQARVGAASDDAVAPGRQSLNLWFLDALQRDAGSFTALAGDAYALRFDMGIHGFEARNTGPQDTRVLPADTPLAGNADQWTPALPASLVGLRPLPGSDIVVLRYLSEDGVPAALTSTSANTYAVAPEPYGARVSRGETSGMFALADCQQVSIFAADDVDAAGVITMSVGGLNHSGLRGEEWSFESAQNKPMLYRAEAIVYYIGLGARNGVDGSKPPSLWRARAIVKAGRVHFDKEELVEGVESMQVLYGLDAAAGSAPPQGNIQRVRTAATVSAAANSNPTWPQAQEWRRVGTVQIGLLMRSPERSAAEQAATAPVVLGVKMQPGAGAARSDGYYRSVHKTTVLLRNRVSGP